MSSSRTACSTISASPTLSTSTVRSLPSPLEPRVVAADGLEIAAFNQWTTEQLIVFDEWCMIAGTDTNL